jgi:iron complex outermembrane recepter protein
MKQTSHTLQRTTLALSISAALSIMSATVLAEENETTLSTLEVDGESLNSNTPLDSYAGGQVSRGSSVGLLGNQNTFDTPYSITSYTAKLLEDQHTDTLADVIVNDSSSLLKSSAGGIGEIISIRGFSMGGNDSELYDGMTGLGRRLFASTEMLERVEILKGANALLTGTIGAPGGTINLIPKQPLDTPLTRLTTSYEYKEALGTHLDVSRRAGDNDEFGVRFNASYKGGEGAIENSDKELKEATLALQYRKEKLQLDAIFDYSAQDLDASPQQYTINSNATEIPDAPDASKAIQQPWETMDDKFNRSYIKAQYQLSDTWSVHGAYGQTSYEGYWFRTTGSNLDSDGNFNQSLNQYFGEDKKTSARVGAEALFSTGSVSHQLSLDALHTTADDGWVYTTESSYSVSSNIYNPTYVTQPGINRITRNAPITTKSTSDSFAVADTIGFNNNQLLLTVGARHQTIKVVNYSASTGAQTSKYDESAITPTVGILAKTTEHLSLYGNYIESLEKGETAPTGSTNAGEVFEPTKTKQVEVGAKWNLGALGLTTSIFQIQKPSGQQDENDHYDLDGEQRNRGVEISAFGNLTQNLRLLGGVTYIDSKLTKTEDGVNQGNTVVGVPEWSAVLGAEWDTPSLEGVTLTGRVNYVGSQYVKTDNSLSIPSYELYSVGARYVTAIADKEVTFRANIDNLFNEKYWETFVASGNRLYTGSPRQISLSATIDF